MFSNNLKLQWHCVITNIALMLQNMLYYIYKLTSIQAQGGVMD